MNAQPNAGKLSQLTAAKSSMGSLLSFSSSNNYIHYLAISAISQHVHLDPFLAPRKLVIGYHSEVTGADPASICSIS
jgi:hypothetical protein